MANKKTGGDFPCLHCGTLIHRAACHIRTNTKLFCSIKCKAAYTTGEKNPFYGKTHPPEVLERIAATRKLNPPKGTGPKKGIFKHTPEARAKMSAALRERWRINRAVMLTHGKNGENKPWDNFKNLPRHHFIFTKEQKAQWTEPQCKWCKSTEELVLDHILPIMCSGTNIRANAQTLCGPCNRWKMKHVDRPLYYALKALTGAQTLNPEYQTKVELLL
jgi:hypothetical protein